MSTPLPGQIRCPTCHRSTPPAAFCTQCGTAIPASARARPRGLDRAELQDRIRTHRPGDAAFRRGSPLGEGVAQPPSPYQPFRPEPEDGLIIPAAEVGEEGALHVDNTPPGFDDRPPPAPPEVTPPPTGEPPPVVKAGPIFTPPLTPFAPTTPVITPPPAAPPPAPPPQAAEAIPPPVVPPPVVPPPVAPEPPPIVAAEPPAPQWAAPQDPYDPSEAYDNRYRPPDEDWGGRGSGGMSPLAIGGFVLLGVLAIAVGAFISGIFSGGVAQATPSPTPIVSAVPSASLNPTAQPTANASAPPASPSPGNGSPVPFPDGFTARTQPCADQPTSQDGCNDSGASVSGGSIWAWIGWRKGTPDDVLGVTIVNESGDTVGHGSLSLSSLCDKVCSGWGRFRFGGLAPGNYTIRLDRNGQAAAEAPFTVTG